MNPISVSECRARREIFSDVKACVILEYFQCADWVKVWRKKNNTYSFVSIAVKSEHDHASASG